MTEPGWSRFLTMPVTGMSVEGDAIDVEMVPLDLGGAETRQREVARTVRRHRVTIRETLDAFELSGVVARSAALASIEGIMPRTWKRNRATQLVGFRVDHKGRLVGESWVPKAGLTPDEFVLYVRRVATECDLFEFALTGLDRE